MSRTGYKERRARNNNWNLQWHFHRVAPRPLIPAQMEFGNEDKERREKLDN